MTSELEALKRLLDTTSSPAPRDGASEGDILPGEGAPKPASPLDVDAIMARFDATVGALAEESARADPVSSPTSAHVSEPAVTSYDVHVTGAEENVQRLGAAMDDAERELDAAFARHRDSNKHAEALRDAELAASRADADAKQRELEELRETFSNTRRVLEARVTAAEDAAAAAAAATRAAETEAAALASARDAAEARAAAAAEAAARVAKASEARENEAGEWVRRATEARAKAETRAEAAEADAEHARESARASRAAARDAESRLEAESAARREATRKLDKYRREYRRRQESALADGASVTRRDAAERARRDSVEEWLREELRNRENTETLFAQLRDLALRPNENGAQIESLRRELDALRASVGKGTTTKDGAAS